MPLLHFCNYRIVKFIKRERGLEICTPGWFNHWGDFWIHVTSNITILSVCASLHDQDTCYWSLVMSIGLAAFLNYMAAIDFHF